MNRPEKFAQDCINSDTEDCIIYPLYKNMKGYGYGHINGKVQRVHRYVCKAVHGEPPDERPQAAHKCGNTSCCNPKHLKWCNQVENEADKYKHGTMLLGSERCSSKLTEENVLFIKDLLKKGVPQRRIAKAFGVTAATISHINTGKNWKHI